MSEWSAGIRYATTIVVLQYREAPTDISSQDPCPWRVDLIKEASSNIDAVRSYELWRQSSKEALVLVMNR